jgi:hypothetical protein
MNFEEMTLDELKEFAKKNDIKVGNIGKEKLIEKIKTEINTDDIIGNDTDFVNDTKELTSIESQVEIKPESTLSSIVSAIDDLEESSDYENETIVDLPIDTVIPVRSITFGSLIYKSRSNNATYIWNEIGAVQPMTIAAITEMNNYNVEFLRKPMVILLDEKAIKQFRLTSVYEEVAKINNLKQLFKLDIATISKTIDNAIAVNMRDILISKARTMYKNGTLTDINIIRLLEQKLQFDLSEIN